MYWKGGLLILLLSHIPWAFAADMESQLMAVFLGRFASYVEWPANEHEEFIITVIGENPFNGTLDEVYQNKKIHGKPVKIRHIRRANQIGKCDLLFVALKTAAERRSVIDFAQKNGILTVSENLGFAERGGVIQVNFVAQNVQIKINHNAAIKSNLRIGAPLLSIATVLQEESL